VSCAVALKAIEIYERRGLVGHVRHVEPVFLKGLAKLAEHPLVGEAKGVGLIAGVELVADKQTKRVFDPTKGVVQMLGVMAEQEGLIVRPLGGERFALCPPLIINEAEIAELFDRLGKALDRTLDWATREKLFEV
jgi:4-aminobutyrate--pyruvate transaminase